MPELPEVETIRRALAPHVEGRRVDVLDVLDPRWCRPLSPPVLAAAVEGRRIERLDRRGKYLIADLDDGAALICHLRMTGTVLHDPAQDPAHTRVRIGLDDGSRLVWVDPRRFGTGELARTPAERDAFLAARLGPEPFDPRFTAEHLAAAARGVRAPVKAFLLDQARVAGVGNIYADEALFRARIHPLRPAGRLTRTQIAALREAVIEALTAGIAAKGASIDDFRDPYGARGTFQDQFLVHLREGKPCPRCARPIVKLRAAGRGTYVCPRCQAKPRATRPPAATPDRPGRPAGRAGRAR